MFDHGSFGQAGRSRCEDVENRICREIESNRYEKEFFSALTFDVVRNRFGRLSRTAFESFVELNRFEVGRESRMSIADFTVRHVFRIEEINFLDVQLFQFVFDFFAKGK